MKGTILDEQDIIEYDTEQMLTMPDRYSVSFTMSGQPIAYVIPRTFSNDEAHDAEFIRRFIEEEISRIER